MIGPKKIPKMRNLVRMKKEKTIEDLKEIDSKGKPRKGSFKMMKLMKK